MKSDLLAASAVLLVAASLPLPLRAEPAPAPAPALPPDAEREVRAADLPTLKAWYLACDRASRAARLEPPVAQACSLTAEALMQRGFGGDFHRLIAWWQGARDDAVAQAPR